MAPPVCPICHTPHAACGTADLAYAPVDVAAKPRRAAMAELHEYEIPHRDHTVTVQLSEEDAAVYPGAKKLGAVKPGEPQPVTRPPYATDDSEHDPADREHLAPSGEKKAEAPQNKARTSNPTKRG